MKESGHLLIKKFISKNEKSRILEILTKFHKEWIIENKAFYESRAVNSAYITSGNFITIEERLELLKFISSNKIVALAKEYLGEDVKFLNTQIFFDPYNKEQRNYWHRDIQFTGKSIEEQIEIIKRPGHEVLHFRIALKDEEGVELIPGTHKRWDNNQEQDIRLERNEKKCFEDLDNSSQISLNACDLLIFDANMIHRGVYGKDRFAFDILFCKNDPSILQYSDKNCFPHEVEMDQVDNPGIFGN